MSPYRRSIFLINRKFQLRFAFYVCSWLFALSLIYPLIIHNLFDYLLRVMKVDPSGPAQAQIQATRGEMLQLLVFLQLLFLAITFLISIFMSHRIAGPLYKLRKAFEEARAGNLGYEVRFRKADHFLELAEDFNATLETVRGIVGKNVESAQAAIARIEKAMVGADADGKKELQEALTALREIRERSRS